MKYINNKLLKFKYKLNYMHIIFIYELILLNNIINFYLATGFARVAVILAR